VEIDEEAQGQTREPEVGEDLGFVDGQKVLDCLDLDENPAIDDEVEPEPAPNQLASVHDRHRALPLDAMATREQLAHQAFLVRRFQEPRPERAMYRDGRPNDRTRDAIQSHL
jgi:hypothetical protein